MSESYEHKHIQQQTQDRLMDEVHTLALDRWELCSVVLSHGDDDGASGSWHGFLKRPAPLIPAAREAAI